jgi:hypothetical protein
MSTPVLLTLILFGVAAFGLIAVCAVMHALKLFGRSMRNPLALVPREVRDKGEGAVERIDLSAVVLEPILPEHAPLASYDSIRRVAALLMPGDGTVCLKLARVDGHVSTLVLEYSHPCGFQLTETTRLERTTIVQHVELRTGGPVSRPYLGETRLEREAMQVRAHHDEVAHLSALHGAYGVIQDGRWRWMPMARREKLIHA